MKTYIKANCLILEIPARALVLGCANQRIEVTDRDAMLKYFVDHLITDETTGEDLKINEVLDSIAEQAVEDGELWCRSINPKT
jgi:hypothetical protein